MAVQIDQIEGVIARLDVPKQYSTRPYSVIMKEHRKNGEEQLYSTHIAFRDELGGCESGHYDLTFSQAWDDFRSRANLELNRRAEIFEISNSRT